VVEELVRSLCASAIDSAGMAEASAGGMLPVAQCGSGHYMLYTMSQHMPNYEQIRCMHCGLEFAYDETVFYCIACMVYHCGHCYTKKRRERRDRLALSPVWPQQLSPAPVPNAAISNGGITSRSSRNSRSNGGGGAAAGSGARGGALSRMQGSATRLNRIENAGMGSINQRMAAFVSALATHRAFAPTSIGGSHAPLYPPPHNEPPEDMSDDDS
jgi:hypothetical protein